MTVKRFPCSAAALAFACAAFAVPASAAELPWNHYSWDIPIVFGDYMAVPGSDSTRLGSMTLTVTSDERRILGGALYYFGTDGKMITQALGGTFTYNDDATVRDTGVIGGGPLTAYNMSNGTCRGCPPRERVNTPTGETIAWKWTGPRAGVLTVNGVSQNMIQAYTGLPLVAPVDYSGVYLLAYRQDYQEGTGYIHRETVHAVRLRAVSEARTYQTVVDLVTGDFAWGSVALPPPGTRLFDVTCVTPHCPLSTLASTSWIPGLDPVVPHEYTLWFDEAGNGRLLGVKRSGGQRIVADRGLEYPRVYGDAERIIGRRSDYKIFPPRPSITEFGLFRIDEATLTGDWKKPGCTSSMPPNCNPAD